MKTVIVTGGIGSGKSAVCAFLQERGIPVYDSDERTKGLYDRQPALIRQLEQALARPLRTPDGRLDRPRLAQLIFSSPQARETLESIVYPFVLKDFKRWRSRFRKPPFVVLESAVILSKPLFDGLADAVVLVEAPQEVRIRRILQRDGVSRESALARMAAQPEISPEKADAVLQNAGSQQELRAAAEALFFQKNAYICKLLKLEE